MQKKYLKPVVFISGHRDLTQEELNEKQNEFIKSILK